ncbi:hypothetical protein DFH06DRAFT_1128752 [Mycena polygramma]|nr:hypothetical protein DFH06DRAFT_1128752 [Mycena polygramma]
MGLRSGTRHTVATPPSSESSSEGNVGMDARTSTPTGRDTLGHSAIEPRPSSQDNAAEAERRSRTADVDEDGATDTSEQPGSHPLQDDGAMSEDPTASRAERATTHQDTRSSMGDGFQSPKRTSRASSAGRSSPVLDVEPKFFGDWFNPQDAAVDVAADAGTTGVKAQSWADFSEDDGLGEIPSGWSRDIKVEPVSPELPPTPLVRSLSPVDSGDEFTLEGLMREVNERMPAQVKQLLARRKAKMGKKTLKAATSVSETTNEKMSKVSNEVSIHAMNVSDYIPVPSAASHASCAAASTPRIPAAAKGKGRDPREGPGIPEEVNIVYSTDEEDRVDKERQIQMDALLAMYLQRQLEKETQNPLPQQTGNQASGSGTKKDEPKQESRESKDSRKENSNETDRVLAERLQALYAENERRKREIEALKAKLADANSRKSSEAKRADSKPTGMPTPMDQMPRDSHMFRAMQGAGDPDDADSSSSTSSEDRRRKSSKRKSKKGSRKGSRKRTKRAKGFCRSSAAAACKSNPAAVCGSQIMRHMLN